MAAEGRSVDEDVLLEVDVGFNEFDDELLNEDELISETAASSKDEVQRKSNEAKSEDKKTSNCELQNVRESRKPSKDKINNKTLVNEDGEISSPNEDMDIDLQTTDVRNDSSKRHEGADDSYGKNKGIRTRRSDRTVIHKRGLDASSDEKMDLDEPNQVKRLKIGDFHTVGGKLAEQKKKRGGVKKRSRMSKYLLLREEQQRHVRPSTDHLFVPLTITENDSTEDIAKELADRLEEAKTDLIHRVVKCIGHTKALQLFEETLEIQEQGGIPTANKDRRRTSGGVFLYLLKAKEYATKEQVKEIYKIYKKNC
ncbi:predicted protein [Nematostella vectensis]|uniref:Phosphorylated adapter RNA export protein n=1 Tax=Nematostella vectensis TaxID=45351 RepID=A7ST76_NEMVE|nr:phosphorylated adapter RNA export protein [Nematostella vectensis]EDO33080.1 predicted protein [Nematostella vectensis]|eukprot:XP_001625180.1 predicted protein [Nematostella vectensis]